MNVDQQALLRLSQRPGSAAEWCDPLADGEIDALNEGRLNGFSEAQSLQGLEQLPALPPFHAPDSVRLAITLLLVATLDQLTICQHIAHHPGGTHPLTEVSGNGEEVCAETIGGNGWNTGLGQVQLEVVEEMVGIIVGPTTKVNTWNDLGHRFDGHPQPTLPFVARHWREQLIKLKVSNIQLDKQQGMQVFAVQPSPCQPTSKRGIDMTGEPDQHGYIHALSKQPQAHLDPVRMGFQVIERCAASGTETGLAALALEGLDILPFATFAIAHQSMNCFIGDTEVATLWIGAGVSPGLDTFLLRPRLLLHSPQGFTSRLMGRMAS